MEIKRATQKDFWNHFCVVWIQIGISRRFRRFDSPSQSNIFFFFLPFADTPFPPIIRTSETETVDCDVNVTWIKPVDNGCPLTMYSVYYREVQSHETGVPWAEVRISDNFKAHQVLRLKCDTKYMIEMSAWNELGQSNRSRRWIIKTISGKFPRSKYFDLFYTVLESRG